MRGCGLRDTSVFGSFVRGMAVENEASGVTYFCVVSRVG